MKHILIVSGDTVDAKMGGVGIRNWEIAKSLAHDFDVTLAIPNTSDLTSSDFHLVSYDLEKGDLRPYATEADVLVVHGFVLHFHPYLRELGKPLAVDLYVPSLLESLVWHDQDDWETWIPAYEEYVRVQQDLIRAGDFFFCASERQRDYWLGWLHALKRINPHTYRQDPSLRRLIDVVPFGLPDEPPQKNSPVLKGVFPGIGESDRVIIWSGGLWDWLDPLTLIQAMAVLAPQHPELKLFFMGTRHPNPVVSGMLMPDKAIDLSKKLDLFGKSVFFGDWVKYEERMGYLEESDLAVISHPGHIETHFSFRTRVLDAIWSGLPIVITEGDAMAGWVENEHLGATVPVGDAAALARAIEAIFVQGGRPAFENSFRGMRDTLRWNRVVRPLVEFCQNPVCAPDKSMYLTQAERVARDKDRFLEQVVRDKDAFYQAIIDDREAEIKRLRSMMIFKVALRIKRLLKGQFS